MTSFRRVAVWTGTNIWLGGCTWVALVNDKFPPWCLAGMWWFMALGALCAATDWSCRLLMAANGRPVHWIIDYLWHLTIVGFLVKHERYLTAVAVLAMMVFEEMIFSTKVTIYKITEDNNDNENGDT